MTESNAPVRDYSYVYERPDVKKVVPTMEANDPLENPNTNAIDIWRRGERRLMLLNKLDVCHHYEIKASQLKEFVCDATSRGISTNYYQADGSIKKVAADGHYLFLCNGGDCSGILEDLDLKSIAIDLFKHESDPLLVPKLNKRGNRGPSLIFTGSQNLNRGPRSQFAKPSISPGSKRYWPAYVKMSIAIHQMAAYTSDADDKPLPDPFPILEDMPLRQEQWAGRMNSKSEIESCSFLLYLSDFEVRKDHIDRLLSHTDRQNGKRIGWDYLATFWEQYFDDDLSRWVMIVASVTTRVSIEEYHTREGIVGNATDLLLKNYATHPISQRLVIPSTLCPDNTALDHLVCPIHFDTLVYLSQYGERSIPCAIPPLHLQFTSTSQGTLVHFLFEAIERIAPTTAYFEAPGNQCCCCCVLSELQ